MFIQIKKLVLVTSLTLCSTVALAGKASSEVESVIDSPLSDIKAMVYQVFPMEQARANESFNDSDFAIDSASHLNGEGGVVGLRDQEISIEAPEF